VRILTGHEKRLALFLILALAAGLHLILLKFLLEFLRGTRGSLAEARGQVAEARAWIGQKEFWDARAEWLEKNFRAAPTDNPAPALQKAAQAAATGAGLKIEGQDLRQPKTGRFSVLYANRMQLSGTLGQFLKWLVAVYRPEQGIAVTALNLKIGPDSSKMAGEAEIGQFFQPPHNP